jgi:Gpi18-like mannosyltransferase
VSLQIGPQVPSRVAARLDEGIGRLRTRLRSRTEGKGPSVCMPARNWAMDIAIQGIKMEIPVTSALPLRSRVSNYARPLAYCTVVVFASRLALLVIGHLSQKFMGSPQGLAPSDSLVDLWIRFDANWYLRIVGRGYRLSTHYSGSGETNVAFFPLWPELLWLASKCVSIKIAELLLPNLLLLIGTVNLHELARLRFDGKVADMAVVSACCFPGSFVFSSAMTESLFFLLAILSFRYLNSRRWLPASVAAALLSITRVNGLAAGCALGIGWLRDRLLLGRTPTLLRELLLILLIPMPLCAFMAFLFWRFGDAFAAFNAHRYFWLNAFVWPFQNLFYIFLWQ